MRYFTRQLHESVQAAALEGIPERVAAANQHSAEVSLQYLDYLARHESQLTGAVRKLADISLHDARITRIRSDSDGFEMHLDTRGAPWIKVLSMQMRFRGVERACGLEEQLVGQYILHEELHVEEDGSFEFSMLCERSEFSLRFLDVDICP